MPRNQDVPVAALRPVPLERIPAHLEVLDRLNDEVLAGRLAAGDRLPPERQLAQMLNVSRTSLREGLAVLEAVGIVRSRTGSGPLAGTFVQSEPADAMNVIMSLQVGLQYFGLDEVIEFRRSVENLAVVKLAGDETTDQTFARALELVSESQTVADAREFARLDMEFHLELVKVSGNRFAAHVVQTCRGLLESRMLEGFGELGEWDAARSLFVAQHREILDAVRSGDPARASAALLAHVTGPKGFPTAR
ncbi:FCD domain-containing protein [Nocardioides carbamazepini]|uniref:FadR/GntR family transcriptional regulator n=1 Tax=Nocardioides carbamazepini TaxID=2854259 RepID=UPI002149C745|nr:FCD domain-containing protein [Nocardioides carbamazepini]MCR1782367.1 FCD domain-containing protein [Nocardioides carbamazepini]